MAAAGLAVGIAVFVLLLLATAVLFEVVRQQGRILLRLDSLEQGTAAEADAVVDSGLSIGTQFPDFELRNGRQTSLSLADFRGRKLLLVNWSPECGFCELLAPDLAKLQPDLKKRNVELVLASYGSRRANLDLASKHGLDCTVAFQNDGNSVQAFETYGTPVAYLVDEEGRVGDSFAVGSDGVLDLAARAAKRPELATERTLSDSRIEREGLPVGTPAPPFSLPDLSGRTVSLDEFRGRRVLLVFSDPACGPCQELTPHLVDLDRRAHGLSIVMVGRGKSADNREKAREHGVEFPVVVQKGWRLSKEYGIFATPVAFLIDQNGVIERDVAQGTNEILALANEAVGVPA